MFVVVVMYLVLFEVMVNVGLIDVCYVVGLFDVV